VLQALGAGSGLLLVHCGPEKPQNPEDAPENYDWKEHFWGYAVDTTTCIGCCACMRACRAENDVPRGYFRTWVERYRIAPTDPDEDPEVAVDIALNDRHRFAPVSGDVKKAFFVPKLCNHCSLSVCNQVCPVGAAYLTPDGVVLVDAEWCIGCGYCVQACPYSTRYIRPRDHVADKCTLCYHRITRGLQPACVEVCPTSARIFGDLSDPKSRLSTILKQRRYRVLRPEMGTEPKCYYFGLEREVV
jgi:Fe-S-cluster-containing dehydrogenase component